MSVNIKTKNENENYVIVPNDYYSNMAITNEEMLMYCFLQKNYMPSKYTGICSINLIKEYMYIENRNNRIIQNIKKGIKTLLNKKIIYNLSDVHMNEIQFDDLKNDTLFCYSLDLPKESYYKVFEYTLDEIFKYLKDNSSNISKFSLIRYFLAINRVISNQENFGYLPQSTVKNICGKSETIQRYNKILQDKLNLIQYNNDYMTPDRHYTSSFFGWYGDNDNFNNLLKNQIASKELIATNKEQSNKRRSNTQKINKVNKKINDADKDIEILQLKAKLAELEEEKKKLEYKQDENNNKKLKGLLNNCTSKTKEKTIDDKIELEDILNNSIEVRKPFNGFYESIINSGKSVDEMF